MVGANSLLPKSYRPPSRQTTEPGDVAAAAPFSVLGDVGLVPELLSFPFGAAYKVQFVASEAWIPVITRSSDGGAPPCAILRHETITTDGITSTSEANLRCLFMVGPSFGILENFAESV